MMTDFTFAITLINVLVRSKLSKPCIRINKGNIKISIIPMKENSMLLTMQYLMIAKSVHLLIFLMKNELTVQIVVSFCFSNLF